jgi:hypothetical protein
LIINPKFLEGLAEIILNRTDIGAITAKGEIDIKIRYDANFEKEIKITICENNCETGYAVSLKNRIPRAASEETHQK